MNKTFWLDIGPISVGTVSFWKVEIFLLTFEKIVLYSCGNSLYKRTTTKILQKMHLDICLHVFGSQTTHYYCIWYVCLSVCPMLSGPIFGDSIKRKTTFPNYFGIEGVIHDSEVDHFSRLGTVLILILSLFNRLEFNEYFWKFVSGVTLNRLTKK